MHLVRNGLKTSIEVLKGFYTFFQGYLRNGGCVACNNNLLCNSWTLITSFTFNMMDDMYC